MKKYDLDGYDAEKHLSPYWKGNVSYAEAAFVGEEPDGSILPIRLLYPADEIISVRSFDLGTLYKRGVDYELDNGMIRILPGSSIPALAYRDYCFEHYTYDGIKTQIAAADDSGKGYIVAEISHEKKGLSNWVIACTYTHSGKSVISEPPDRSDRFSGLSALLSAKKEIKAVLYGDSITYGWSATGFSVVNRPPFSPPYTDMAFDRLEKEYGAKIIRKNLSVSGKDTGWAIGDDNIAAVVAEAPDLLVLAFGMNDGVHRPPEEFGRNIDYIVREVSKGCPDVGIAVVLPMLPNSEVGFTPGTTLRKYQPGYPSELTKLEKGWDADGIRATVVDVTSRHAEMLTVKSFRDCSSSNTNHPSDYIHRFYAQILLRTLCGI